MAEHSVLLPNGLALVAGGVAGNGQHTTCYLFDPTGTRRMEHHCTARPNRLATIEAIARALQILEGPTAGDEIQRRLDHIFRVMVDRTLWTNGRISTDAVTGGIPPGIRSHDPLGIG